MNKNNATRKAKIEADRRAFRRQLATQVRAREEAAWDALPPEKKTPQAMAEANKTFVRFMGTDFNVGLRA